MDRSWINAIRTTEEYENGVEEFLKFAKTHLPPQNGEERYLCPCSKCVNDKLLTVREIKEHVICDGFHKKYKRWIWHGEVGLPSVSRNEEARNEEARNEEGDEDMLDNLEDLINDIGAEAFEQAHENRSYEALSADADKPLYPGCKNFSRLSAALKLISLKATHGWTDRSFTELLSAFKSMLPENNELPESNYQAKKILCPLGLGYKKIHACPNDCVLYRKEYKTLHECPKCGTSRYKKSADEDADCDVRTKKPPAKVLWYLPIIPRFRRLFASPTEAKNLRWHADERIDDGQLRHPADSPQWKKMDQLYPSFGNEPRNLRLGLCTDGMNPYGNLSSQHSAWPVLLVIYNLSPLICMKRKYIMLSMMISGPKQPGNDIDVYMQPLMEDLKKLFVEGVDVFDSFKREIFKMRAMIFCTINDFPAYGNLSGYCNKGHKACPKCGERTSYHQLEHGKKTVYLDYRKWLKDTHPYRKMMKAFNGKQEEDSAPVALTPEEVYDQVKDINITFGKTQQQKRGEKSVWKKRSIFFELPYWKSLQVKHCIDVMHVEKNVSDSLIGTLLNIQGKTKDNLNARKDMEAMGMRRDLAPRSDGKRIYLPPACHTLSKSEKKSLCECLRGVKVPQGFSSNVKRLVSIKELKLLGLKSHDHHVLMQQLLPIAIRGILPKKVRNTISRLCFFFNSICSKVIDPQVLDDLDNDAAIILSELEMYFPPSFFDIMVHLIIHLVSEIRECGPVHLRWMYPFERYMKILKGYVKNPHRPEASIVERYVAEEAIDFCKQYFSETESVGHPTSRHEGRGQARGTLGGKVKNVNRKEVLQAHLYILNNIPEVQPYLDAHKALLKEQNPRQSQKWLKNAHNNSFSSWFKKQVPNDDSAPGLIGWLAGGPNFDVLLWQGYAINGYSFYTKERDDKSTVQNSGVTIEAEQMHFSSSKDKNPLLATSSYFGIIEEIWEVDYLKFKIPVFKCKWVNCSNGVKVDELGVTSVDFSKLGCKKEPFVMASQAKQVFYITDPSNKKMSVVLHGKKVISGDDNDESNLDVCEISAFSPGLPGINNEVVIDDIHAVRIDHSEGMWENIPIVPTIPTS